jgi:hypothetical protein
MRRSFFLLAGVAAVAAWLLAGCATTDEAKAARETARMRTLQTQLIVRDDADSLAASALFARVLGYSDDRKPFDPQSRAEALELATRAVAAAPKRAELLLEQLQLCQEVPSCNSETLEARLLELDPENGMPWTYALMRAASTNNPEAMHLGRAGLARSQRVEWYWNEIISRTSTAVAGKAGFDAGEAMIAIIGIEAAFPAAFQPILTVCSAQEIQQPEVLAQCRQIATAYRRADTTLFQMVGLSLATRLWPEGSAERAEITAERRALHYRTDLMTRNEGKLNSVAALTTLATLLGQYRTEPEAFRALFIGVGLNPDPPADWVDHTE